MAYMVAGLRMQGGVQKGVCMGSGGAQPGQGVGFDVRQFIRLGRVAAVAASPCGRWVAVQVDRLAQDGARFVGELWRVDRADAVPPHRLTSGEHGDRAPAFRADGALLFLSSRPRTGETARTQVWCLPALGGEPVAITDEPLGVEAFQVAADALVVQAPVWPGVAHAEQRTHDDNRRKRGPSALRYDRMPVRHWDHWLPTAAPHLVAYRDGIRLDLTPTADREHRQAQWHLAASGTAVVVTRQVPGTAGINDIELCLLQTATGAQQTFAGGPGIQLEEPRLSADAACLVCVRTPRPHPPVHRPRLCVIDTATGAQRALAEDWEGFAHPVAFTPDGSGVVVTVDEGGRVPAYRVALADGTRTRLSASAAGGSHAGLSVADDGHLVGIRSTFTQPPRPFTAPLTADTTPQLLADLSGFDAAQVPVVMDEFSTASTDGTPVQSFLLRPPGAQRLPLLLWIHGGPMGAHSDAWHWRWNPLLATAAGFAVALPNPRGSTGFGQAFVDGVWDNRTGAECFHDLMSVTDALAARADLDPARFVAMGGSFGGYMANLMGTRTDRFAALVSHAGIYSYPQFRSTTDEPGWFAYGFGFEPDTDAEAFTVHSPQRFVAGWRTPTLILHGDRDFRVPVSEGLALFEALQRHGVPSELVVFPDENHWILRPQNVVAWYDAWLDFVGRHLSAAQES